MKGPIAPRVLDTLRALADLPVTTRDPEVLAIEVAGVPYSVAYARFVDLDDHTIAMYGFTYTRALTVAAVANLVFRETPLLPISFAGARWNYDTTAIRNGEVVNDSLLGMRITDRAGHVLWQSRDQAAAANSPYSERVVLSTATGGLIVESSLRASSEAALLPSVVRRVQRWSLSALLAFPLLLAAVSLLALRGERIGARARRAEAMQQLALGLRHELNNALASVMLNAELLGEDSVLSPLLRERLEAIVEQAERMRSVLRRLEKADRLDVVVPYLNEGYMVDLSSTMEREKVDLGDRSPFG
jgi:signal transduction histidine kinase